MKYFCKIVSLRVEIYLKDYQIHQSQSKMKVKGPFQHSRNTTGTGKQQLHSLLHAITSDAKAIWKLCTSVGSKQCRQIC